MKATDRFGECWRRALALPHGGGSVAVTTAKGGGAGGGERQGLKLGLDVHLRRIKTRMIRIGIRNWL
jgi:hypothetical protein